MLNIILGSALQQCNGPVVVCESGHSVCRECAVVVDVCPTCKEEVCPVEGREAKRIQNSAIEDCGGNLDMV